MTVTKANIENLVRVVIRNRRWRYLDKGFCVHEENFLKYVLDELPEKIGDRGVIELIESIIINKEVSWGIVHHRQWDDMEYRGERKFWPELKRYLRRKICGWLEK